jgi:hypothetical protein
MSVALHKDRNASLLSLFVPVLTSVPGAQQTVNKQTCPANEGRVLSRKWLISIGKLEFTCSGCAMLQPWLRGQEKSWGRQKTCFPAGTVPPGL